MDRRTFLAALTAWAASPAERISVFALALRPRELERYRTAVGRLHSDARWLSAAARIPVSGNSVLPAQRGLLFFYERLLNRALPGDPIRVPYWPWENRYATPASRLPSIYGNARGSAELSPADVDVEPALALRSADDFLAAAPIGAPAAVAARLRLTPADPAYWSHLANVDRMWASWIDLGDGRRSPNFRQAQIALPDETGTVRTVALQHLSDLQQLGYRYSTLIKPLALGASGLVPVSVSGGYAQNIPASDTQDFKYLLLRRTKTRAVGRTGLFAGRWRLVGSWSAVEPQSSSVVLPAKVLLDLAHSRPQLLTAPLDPQGNPIGNGAPLDAREAYLF